MKITANGNPVEIARGMSILEVLNFLDVDRPDMVSVELNGTILGRAEHETTVLTESDKLEFLYFMGGGSLRAVK